MNAREFAARSLPVRPPGDGLVVVGCPVSCVSGSAVWSPTAAVGPAAAQASVVDAAVSRVLAACACLLAVLPSAVPARRAESLVFRVVLRSVLPRLSFVCRVCPPAIVVSRAAPAFAAVERVLAVCLGWSDAEMAASRPLLGWPTSLGGFGVTPLEVLAPASFLASWLAAPAALGWVSGVDECARHWASLGTSRAAMLSGVFAAMRDAAPASFPASLAGLDVSSLSPAFRRDDRPRWQGAFVQWLQEASQQKHLLALGKKERAALGTRAEECGGAVLEMAPPYGFVLTVATWRTAARLRAGLKPAPAFCMAPESRCALHNAAGVRCPNSLDELGHHALCCSSGGGWCARHDHIRELLASALRRYGAVVHTERWTHELFDERKRRHARMDLVVFVGGACYYLDVTCTHPFSSKGVPRPAGRVAKAAEEKFDRYRTVVNGVRVTSAHLVPICLSSYGAVGVQARAFFSMLGRCSEDREGARAAEVTSSLTSLCSFLAVMHSAQNCMAAFTSPAHGPGRRPSVPAASSG